MTEHRWDESLLHLPFSCDKVKRSTLNATHALYIMTVRNATLSPSLTRGKSPFGMQSCKIWSTFYSALHGSYACAPPFLTVWIQIHLLYSCLHRVFPEKSLLGFI